MANQKPQQDQQQDNPIRRSPGAERQNEEIRRGQGSQPDTDPAREQTGEGNQTPSRNIDEDDDE